jgi:hypothetical protein
MRIIDAPTVAFTVGVGNVLPENRVPGFAELEIAGVGNDDAEVKVAGVTRIWNDTASIEPECALFHVSKNAVDPVVVGRL